MATGLTSQNEAGAAGFSLVEQIDNLLPQTQCRLCGFPSCRAYAEALATGRADIDQCPPGGNEGARKLAIVLGVAYKPVNSHFGITKPPARAVIDETLCIGCTLCIQACPVDAIVGAAKLMHTIIASNCTGCELCIPPCPVDCISLVNTGTQPTHAERRIEADLARQRFELREARRRRDASVQSNSEPDMNAKVDQKTVQRAIDRARQRLAQRGNPNR